MQLTAHNPNGDQIFDSATRRVMLSNILTDLQWDFNATFVSCHPWTVWQPRREISDRFPPTRNGQRSNRHQPLPKSGASMGELDPWWRQSRSNSVSGLRACHYRRHKGQRLQAANPW